MNPILKTCFFGILICFTGIVLALAPGDVSMQMISGPLFHSDQNECTSGKGPRAVYVGLEICNTSGIDLGNVDITLSGFTGAGYALAGNQKATLALIDPFQAGACDTLFWFCTYPCGTSSTDVIFTATDRDDLSSFQDTVYSVSSSRELSANAGGFVTSSTLSLQDSINHIVCFTVYYGLSKLVPGNQVFLQPVANLDFKADCYQLEHAEVLSSDANSPGCIPVGPCPLYYSIQNTCGGSPTWVVVVEYCFKVQCEFSNTAVIPYASATSGNDLKYTIASQPLYLPVELTDFQGVPNSDGIYLHWSVLAEHEIAYYELQRSPDALHFVRQTKMPASSLSRPMPGGITYTYTDRDPLEQNYYRLKIVGLDSSVRYSDILRVTYLPKSQSQYVFFPNPAHDRLMVRDGGTGEQPPADMQIELWDLSGNQTAYGLSGSDPGDLNITGLPPGMYFIRLLSGGQVQSGKFLKQ